MTPNNQDYGPAWLSYQQKVEEWCFFTSDNNVSESFVSGGLSDGDMATMSPRNDF